ncbi:MAG: hypothetical protein H7289_00805 [Mucilaginibacter sp.]|nr:hypothetical protein [Mucilaginibacter sp.]
MKTRFLLPQQFKYWGVALLVLALVCIIIVYSVVPSPNINGLTNMVKLMGSYRGCFPAIFVALLFIGFSKEKIEDENIAQMRLESLQWAVITNYIVLFYCFLSEWLMGNNTILTVMLLNLLTPIVFFIIRFRWKIWQLNRLSNTEEVPA